MPVGAASEKPAENLSLLGKQGDGINARAAPRALTGTA
jgi:hypothetical protein